MDVRVIRRESIVQPEGRTRGWAQADFEGIPADAPQHLDFAPLRLFGQGTMLPGEGFEMHRHEGIENILLLRSGRFRHRGSDGSDWLLNPDDVFVMSAGSGAEHAEHVDGEEPADCVAIWLHSAAPTADASFARDCFDARRAHGRLAPLASGGALRCGGLPLRCNAAVYRADLDAGAGIEHAVPADERTYVAALEGTVSVAGRSLSAADRTMVTGPGTLGISSTNGGSVIVVQMLTACHHRARR